MRKSPLANSSGKISSLDGNRNGSAGVADKWQLNNSTLPSEVDRSFSGSA
jgi:hypothetical protein